jgi:pheromone shutdown protein TraB
MLSTVTFVLVLVYVTCMFCNYIFLHDMLRTWLMLNEGFVESKYILIINHYLSQYVDDFLKLSDFC